MLKERKLLRNSKAFRIGDKLYDDGTRDIVGWYTFDSYLGDLSVEIKDDDSKANINEEEYFITEFESEASESDYHSIFLTYGFKGVYLAFNLNVIDTLKYFNVDISNELFNEKEFLEGIETILENHNMIKRNDSHESLIDKRIGYLQVVLLDKKLDSNILECAKDILSYIRKYYDKNAVHITRMFGSYVLLKKVSGELRAIKATPIPIKYCPLMIKLLKEVGGSLADVLISSLTDSNEELQTENMCKLINEVVIKGGYFDTSRPLNSCEANVTFGASETLSSAFANNLIDAAVIVSNNLGTIITTNSANTQGSVKRMTGLFYTSPSNELTNTAIQEGIIPVFPNTAEIDQLEGVKMAIALGYKNIAVTVAADNNYLLEEIKKLETGDVKIYKFGLCSTGISEYTAMIMQNNADVIWSCASKYVKELIEPVAIAQVGVKIPVHIMNKQGWEIVRNHLQMMSGNDIDVKLEAGERKPVILNQGKSLKLVTKNELHNCNDCPHPCI